MDLPAAYRADTDLADMRLAAGIAVREARRGIAGRKRCEQVSQPFIQKTRFETFPCLEKSYLWFC